jgi:hypothetical protein
LGSLRGSEVVLVLVLVLVELDFAEELAVAPALVVVEAAPAPELPAVNTRPSNAAVINTK